jgi:transposase
VTASEITELQSFSRGLVEDRAAVEAALTLPWSDDQTEGQVNKLKLLKRHVRPGDVRFTAPAAAGSCLD